MKIGRTAVDKLQQLAVKFPFVTITGPRQSGKSTLAETAFPDFRQVSLEDLDNPICRPMRTSPGKWECMS